MEWKGDEATLSQICQLFELASSPDNNVQQQVMQSLNQTAQLPDFNMYLAFIFARLPGQPEVVRQRAGLLLKTNLARLGNLPPAMSEYVQMSALMAVRHQSKVIRHTAGTVMTTVFQKVGVLGCRQMLDQLAELLGDGNADVLEGSFNALAKVCEDGVSLLRQLWDAPPEYTQPFVSFCAEKLLPRVFDYAAPQAPLVARQNAIECLNHFALNYVFGEQRYPELAGFAQRYVEVLGVLANDSDVEVLSNVCKGFVCVIENGWSVLNMQNSQVILHYMLKASQHPDYAVRSEALEVWTPSANSKDFWVLVQPMLPDLLPVLMQNMIYAEADYCAMEASQVEDDNAQVPDRVEDVKPRFHKDHLHGGAGDEDDEDGQQSSGGAWGAEWTARKAAAMALDTIATNFRGEILPVVLPLIQQKLEDSNWEVQESGVLALGAIATGCMQNLVQFLPRVFELLLRLVRAPKPLLRSIACWACCRYSSWMCNQMMQHPSQPQPSQEEVNVRGQVLRMVLEALLERVLDRNKRVQEAACSAFATLEEEARMQLVPYLGNIIDTLVRALQYYQAKNLLILYDAIGTLAESVGTEMQQPQYVQALVTPLMAKFDAIPENDRASIALFECLSSLTQNVGPAMLPAIPRLADRCVKQIMTGAGRAQMWQQNPNEYEKPDREVMAASIDLLAGIVEGLQGGVKEILAQQNFILVIPEVLKDTGLQVRQSAFALLGDSAKFGIEYVAPLVPQLLPLCAKSLRENSSGAVSNNASWAVGEICMKVGPEAISPYLEEVAEALASIIMRPGGQHLLNMNVGITLGRLGVVCGPHMGKAFGSFAQRWCVVMRHARLDCEKITAFEGMCNMVKANPQACLGCVPELAAAICSIYPAPQQLSAAFREIIYGYRDQLGGNWPQVYAQFPDDLKSRLAHMYGLSS